MADTKPTFWKRRTFCLITGASQGIGRQIAVDFAEQVANNSVFILIARNIEKLNKTKELMELKNNNIQILVHSVDLYNVVKGSYLDLLQSDLHVLGVKPTEFDLALLVHNAGSIGDVSKHVVDMNDSTEWQHYLNLNLLSVVVLNSEFLQVFDLPDKKSSICIINITSLCAVTPFASMGFYCVGKAGREMFFKVLAKEKPEYLVLSYSPGPVETDMTDDIIEGINNDEMKNMFIDMKEKQTLLKVEQTVSKLVKLLDVRDFDSGSRVDYYDR